ncbi:MAG: S8 family serine peptidase [Phycisphaerae bacterium]|nr:S8 family serine peptidase [Phycisphaerae bacterium]
MPLLSNGSNRVAGWGAFAIATVALFVAAMPAAAQAIEFRGDLAAAAAQPDQNLLSEISAAASSAHIVMQFEQPITPAEREELRGMGIELLAPLGSNAFFATVHGQQLDPYVVQRGTGLGTAYAIQPAWKMHPMLVAGDIPAHAMVDITDPENPTVAAYVLFHRDVDLTDGCLAAVTEHGARIVDLLWSINGAVVELPLNELDALVAEDRVQWVEPPLPPMDVTNDSNRTITQANTAQAAPYSLYGDGVTVLVYDGGTVRSTHADFGGRVTVHDSSGMADHATHVAGTIGGDGSSSMGSSRGMAPGVTLHSYGFEYDGSGTFLYTNPGDIESDYNQAINTYGCDISNNSIGSNVEPNYFSCAYQGDYGATSQLIDAIVRGSLGAPFRIVWANGNERQGSRCDVEGYGDYYSMAPPAGAKNNIAVGALNSNDDSMTTFSSWGPMDDGRMKPDICGPGCQSNGDGGVTSCSSSGDSAYTTMCGTSMASPTVCGLLALVLEDYRVQFGGSDPLNSTLKVLLAHNAVDLGNTGPDYQYGYGSVRIVDTIDFMRTGQFEVDEVDQGATAVYEVVVAAGTSELKLTLAWDDYPGTPNVNPTLVNDLDLQLFAPGGTQAYPWTLTPTSPSSAAVRTQANRLDNIEQVLVNSPAAGTWRVEVLGYNVPEGPQSFSLASSEPLIPAPNVNIALPSGVPSLMTPGVGELLSVSVAAENDTLVAGSEKMLVRYDGGSYMEFPLTALGGTSYEVALPPPTCAATPEFYFTAEGVVSGPTSNPTGAPSSTYTATVGTTEILFADNFETDLGWSVVNSTSPALTDGPWTRGIPVGGGDRGDPPTDYDGSGQCYLTDNVDDNSDVDGGYTWLISPTIDLSSGDATLSYALWYSNDYGDDPDNDLFKTWVSHNDGTDWTLAETIGPASQSYWAVHSFTVSAGATVRLRFEASDLNSGSVVEAGIDAVDISRFGCGAVLDDCNGNAIADSDDISSGRSADSNGNNVPDECEGLHSLGDMNCDGSVDVFDIDAFVLAITDAAGYNAAYPDCDINLADANQDSTVDVFDIDAFVSLITGG